VNTFTREHMPKLTDGPHVTLEHTIGSEAKCLYLELFGSNASLRIRPSERKPAVLFGRCLARRTHSSASSSARARSA
jgi:hypothetical protein